MPTQRAIKNPIALLGALTFALAAPALLVWAWDARGGGFDYVRVAAWLCCVAGLLGLGGCVGVEVRGRVGGVVIDERNRYSLSRLQMLAWTTLLVASLYTLFLANAIRGDAAQSIMKIEIDLNLLVAAGFSLASSVAAPMALSRKADTPSAARDLEKMSTRLTAEQNLSRPAAAVGRVVVKGTVDDARLADLFRGEDVQNAGIVDMSRLQMLLVSAVVILGYCVLMVVHFGSDKLQLHSLPAFSPTVLTLILISHSGYLAGKVTPTTPATATAAAEDSAKVIGIAKEATDVAARADALIAQVPPGNPTLGSLRQTVADARRIASEADKTTDADALARRLAVAQTALAVAVAQSNVASEAPDAAVIRQVQGKLNQRGFVALDTGNDDAQTQRAIGAWMSVTKTDQTSLATGRKEFYEELLQLI